MGSATGATAYTFKVQAASSIIRAVRKAPPVHYQFEIESFGSIKTSVKEAPDTYIESTEFEAGGYKWALVIYPNGDKDDQGEDHISLYLKLIDDLDHACFVEATVKFLIYDYKRRVYLTIQDTGEYTYDALEKRKGFAKALPLSDFISSSNGFLQNGRCMFGTEVFVADVAARYARLSTLNKNTNSIFTWKIEAFSKLQDLAFSDKFIWEGHSWRLKMYPRGWGETKNSSMSLYLILDDSSELPNGRKLYVEKELRVKNLQNREDVYLTTRGWFRKNARGWGSPNLMSVTDLHDSNKGFNVDDQVIVQVKLKLMMLVDNV